MIAQHTFNGLQHIVHDKQASCIFQGILHSAVFVSGGLPAQKTKTWYKERKVNKEYLKCEFTSRSDDDSSAAIRS